MNLLTRRLKLRRFTKDDLDLMVQLESDPEVMKFTPLRKPIDRDTSFKRLQSRLEKEHEWAPLGVWAVEQRSDSDFVGWFMLLKTTHPFPELGFMLVRRHWGKGYATEAAQELIRYAFDEIQLPGLYAVTDFDNAVSKTVLIKLGFKHIETSAQLDIYRLDSR